MKNRILQLLIVVSISLFASTAFAGDWHGRGHGYRGHHGHHGHHGRHYRRHGHHRRYYRPRRRYTERHVYHHYNPAPAYVPVPTYAPRPVYNYGYANRGYVSSTPIIAGSLIGGVVGAEIGHGGPLALGGALLGASIGRDIAYRNHYRR